MNLILFYFMTSASDGNKIKSNTSVFIGHIRNKILVQSGQKYRPQNPGGGAQIWDLLKHGRSIVQYSVKAKIKI